MTGATDHRWWEAPDGMPAHELVMGAFDQMEQAHSARRTNYEFFRALYMQRGASDGSPAESVTAQFQGFYADGQIENIIASAVDTLVSIVAANPATPTVATIGKWSLQRKARQLTRFIEGQFERLSVHQHMRQMLRDSLVYGTGFLKVCRDGADVCVERLRPANVITDPLEEFYGAVRTVYVVTPVERSRLRAMFPEAAADIEISRPRQSERVAAAGLVSHGDFVDVVECWHQRSSKNANDGRHAIVCDGVTLLQPEPWERDYLPVIPYSWVEDPERYWGQGVVEKLVWQQSYFNRLTHTEAEAMALLTPHYWVPAGSGVNVERVTNRVGAFYTFEGGVPPILQTPQPISPAYLQRQQVQRQSALESVGVSMQTAYQTRQVGAESGKAQLVAHDIEAQRQGQEARRYELVAIDIGKRLLDALEDIYHDDDTDKAALRLEVGERTLQSLEYGKLRFSDKEPRELRVFPSSTLSKRLEGRFREVEMLLSARMIRPDVAKKLMDIPDIESFTDREQAGMDLVDKLIEDASGVSPGETVNAVGVMVPFDYATWAVTQEMAMVQVWDGPDHVLDALSDLLGQFRHTQQELARAEAEQAATVAAASGPVPPPTGLPPGAGLAPPPGPPPGDMTGVAI